MNQNVSIIICTYNGLKRLPDTLDCIMNQTSKTSFELIIVDNNSNDGTSDFVKKYLKDSEVDWKIVSEPQAGLSHARWRGIAEAIYEIVLFCDDDNHLATDYIEIGASKFTQNSNLGILGGLGSPKFASQKPTWFDQFSHSYAVGSLGKKPGLQKKGSWHYGAACFFRKLAFMQLKSIGFVSVLTDRKGVELSSGGDVELCIAVQLLGYNLEYDPTLKFEHFIETHRLDWDYYLRLTRGIASSFPLLESYKIESYNSKPAFLLYLTKRFLFVLLGLLKCKLTSNSPLESQVNTIYFIENLRVFKKNITNTIIGFERNRKIFKEIILR